jgi:hypothetical protein
VVKGKSGRLLPLRGVHSIFSEVQQLRFLAKDSQPGLSLDMRMDVLLCMQVCMNLCSGREVYASKRVRRGDPYP